MNAVDYSAIKRNDVLIHSTTWKALEDIPLGERSQTHKATDYEFTYIKCSE